MTLAKYNGIAEIVFLNDAHKDLKVDFAISNPPFNDSDYSGELLRDDEHWKFGYPLSLMQIMRELRALPLSYFPQRQRDLS